MEVNSIDWSNLKNIKCISGRAATESDVSEGSAVFVLKSDDILVGRPLPITLPQYAYHIDSDENTKSPCVLIQAEAAGGNEYGGCILISDGSLLAGFINEFELLGNVVVN
jgi:hypothetical protein